jgi:hypothetical protein
LSEPDEDKAELRLLPEEPEEPEEESHAVQDDVVVVGAAVTFGVAAIVVATVVLVVTALLFALTSKFPFAVHLPSEKVQSPLHIVITPAAGSVVSHFAQEDALCSPQSTSPRFPGKAAKKRMDANV